MSDTTSVAQTSYQVHDSNTGRWFGRICGRSYGRGWDQGHEFNSTKKRFEENVKL